MLTHRRIFFRGILLALLVIALDQWSKRAILAHFAESPSFVEITSFFNLTLVWNRGVSFGMFNGVDAKLLLLGFTGCIALGVVIWLWRAREGWLSLPLGLIIGGAVGNIYDRATYGAVVDFLDFHVSGQHWPSFNVADSCIVVGVSIIAWRSLIFPKAETM